MQISSTTLGVVLQPGAVLWFFEDDLQMRRGGPLKPGVPGAVLNQFSIVDRRLYWATSANLILAESLEAPSELLHDPAGDLGVRWPQADDEFVVWEEWDGEDALDLWAAPVPTTVADFEPRHIALLPEVSPVRLGEGLVAFVETMASPPRVLLYDLRNDDVLEWTIPLGWLVGVLWVNREGVGLSAVRESATLFATVMTVPFSSFEPL